MMKKTIFISLLVSLFLVSCAEKGKLLMLENKLMCLSEDKETCIEMAEEKCSMKGYRVLREESEDNTWPFEDDRYILTFQCNE